MKQDKKNKQKSITKEKFIDPDESRTSQEKLQNQIMWTQRNS